MIYRNNEGDFRIGPAEIELALKAEAIGREYDRIDWAAVIADALEQGVEAEEMRQHYAQLHADEETHRLRLVTERDVWRGKCHTLMVIAGLSWLVTLVVWLVG